VVSGYQILIFLHSYTCADQLQRHTFSVVAAEGAAQPSEAVGETVHDALTDRFLMPYYTVGYDALLGQMARDLIPESVYEYVVAKSWGCL
jgi:hypothetical protein